MLIGGVMGMLVSRFYCIDIDIPELITFDKFLALDLVSFEL